MRSFSRAEDIDDDIIIITFDHANRTDEKKDPIIVWLLSTSFKKLIYRNIPKY